MAMPPDSPTTLPPAGSPGWFDAHKDAGLIRALARQTRLSLEKARERLGRRPVIMEVCGTHTVALSRSGIRSMLGDLVDLRSGPGCPVCVTSAADIDRIARLAVAKPRGAARGRVIATFGDLVRVPGSQGSLETMRARGARVVIVYSPLAAVELAAREPENEVVFLGVGFETTAPGVALSIKAAAGGRLRNFSVYGLHKLTPPAVAALLGQGDVRIDGFLLPGHVSTVVGSEPWEFIASRWKIPAVVAGFEPLDLLSALFRLGSLLEAGRAELANDYARAVKKEGNPVARKAMEDVFEVADADWRGLGLIPASGLAIRSEWANWDEAKRFADLSAEATGRDSTGLVGCRCGDVLRGKILPYECPLFGRECTPHAPVGPCMVSSEGACACYFQYGRGDTGK